jgi:hypothetical protein
MARKTLKMWGDASAIRLLEVEGKDAELKFQWKWEFGDFSGRAEFPKLERETFNDEGVVRHEDGGNIYLNARYRPELRAHNRHFVQWDRRCRSDRGLRKLEGQDRSVLNDLPRP